jgi:hypothetical protein
MQSLLKIPNHPKRKNKNRSSPDWREHPALFQGRCGRKAGIWKPEKAQAIRSKKYNEITFFKAMVEIAFCKAMKTFVIMILYLCTHFFIDNLNNTILC